MALAETAGHMIDAGILELLRHERTQALSNREWKFRLGAHGLAVKDVQGKQIVTRLPQGIELGVIPADVA
ncbi:hypothetical protein QEZ52_00550 [Aliisedimentitalea scapharcae]|uniref:Uncharacterized protein n=1 Tax=Aliisedimentitalea scapharcae TaxID=1524259 RepID=A0ABZ2XT87_9RHOB|nr:hypothetical protein K3727_00255 [Rhodobacteraceae bacterium M382]